MSKKSSLNTNAIFCGDCEEVLHKYVPDKSIDLIYVDPPFFSQKDYEVIWGDGYEKRAFKDRWKGGIQHYIRWMEPKIREIHRVLKDSGSFYLHCDYHANAHLRILLDKIFGKDNFRNEIIWHYFMGGKAKSRPSRKHDTIFFYTKSDDYTYHPFYKLRRLPYKPSLSNPSDVNLDEKIFTRDGFVEPPDKKTGKDDIGYYSVVGMDDVWDISGVFNLSNEYMGYPTQKPKTLLELIVKASSNPTDVVLDPMCGCGTAIAAAHDLGRRWIGIDVSPTACKVMAKRLRKKLGYNISKNDVIGLPRSLEEIKEMEPFEFQNWVMKRLGGKSSEKLTSDGGIDGRAGFPEFRLVQVKQHRVGRSVVDKFETALRRKDKEKGVVVGFSFTSGAYEEVARVKNKGDLDIKLTKVEEIMKVK